MNEEQLKLLNLEEAQISSVLKLHREELDGSYVTKSRFNEVNTENKELKSDITKRDEQLEELKKVDPEKLQGEITSLQDQNKTQKEEYESKLQKLRVDHALNTQLSKAKVRNPKAVAALLNLDDAELDEHGSLKGVDEQLTALKESDSYLFDTEDTKKHKFKGAQPGSSEKDKTTDPVDFSKMTYAEIDAYLRENQD